MFKKLLSLVSFVCVFLYAAAYPTSFRHISVEDGLSKVTVLAITQDHKGYMWFAHGSSLDRYDGYSFRTFSSENLVSKKSSNIICDGADNIICDFNDQLAVCDGQSVMSYQTPDGKRITSIISFGAEGILVITTQHSYIFKDGSYSEALLPSEFQGERLVQACNMDEDDLIILLSSGTMWRWNPSNLSPEMISSLPEKLSPVCILFHEGYVWVGTEGKGVYGIRVEDGNFVHLTEESGDLPSDFVRCFGYDSENELLVGTLEGLAAWKGGMSTIIKNTSESPSSLSYNSVRSIYMDRDGGGWIGTFYGGINYFHSEASSFRRYAPYSGPHTSEDNIFSSIAIDSGDATVWMGYGHRGIAHYYPSEERMETMIFPQVQGRVYDVKAILPDPAREKVWIGSRLGGFGYIDRRTLVYHQLPIPVKDVYGILEDGPEGLLLNTNLGLLSYNCISGDWHLATESRDSSSHGYMWRDSYGNVWTGPMLRVLTEGDDGIMHVLMDHPLHLTPGVYSFYESNSGIIYISSYSGLIAYNPGTGFVKVYGKENGISSTIACILGEDQGMRLWIGLSNSLCYINEETGAVKMFGKENGYSPDWLIQNCCCALNDGRFLFGTIDGFITFNPEHSDEDSFSPTPVICSARVVGDEGELAPGNLTLSHDCNSLEFSFATFNYKSSGNEHFACIMDGLEKEWRYIDGTNSVRYLLIPPGKYTFRLKAANSDGIWSEDETGLELVIRPEFIKSIPFKIAVSLLTLLIIAYILVTFIRSREKRIREQERSRVPKNRNNQLSREDEIFLAKAENLIKANISNSSFCVDDFAREMGISRAGLYNRIKVISGCSPMDLLMEERWKIACHLLRDTGRSVADIAEEVGFASASYFTRAFKKRFDLLPSAYRRS